MAARSSTPAGLGKRGASLWKSLGFELDSASGVLALEACRLADRLERLDNLLTGGDSWFEMVELYEGANIYRVVVNNALSEARQQQVAFKALLESLGVKGGAAAGKPAGPAPAPTRSGLDELRARREAR